MADPGLITAPMKRVVRAIRTHDHGLSDTYIAMAARDRVVLVAKNVVTCKAVDHFSGRTLYQLERHGLITVDPAERDLPDYQGRRHLDSRKGQRVSLTESGRAL